MKVSFILPIYNVEKYLGECIKSLLVQTYTNFEIILVDDASPDNCPKLCDEWAQKDNRIKVLHKPNGGLSDARNAGLNIATGDYIIFVDSDDFWVNKDCLQKLMDVVKENRECDFISFNCSYYYQDTKSYKKWVAFDEKLTQPINKDTAIHSLVASGTMPMSACLKVIKRKFLSDMKISFIKGILSEDIPWFIDLLDRCKKCMFVNQYIYAYRKGVVGSITSSKSYNYRNFSNLLGIVDSELEKINRRSFSDSAKKALMSFWAYEICILIGCVHMLDNKYRRDCKRSLKKYTYLFEFTENPKVKKVALIYKYLGFNVTEFFLRVFMESKKYREK